MSINLPATGFPIKVPNAAKKKEVPNLLPISDRLLEIELIAEGGKETTVPAEMPYRTENTINPGVFLMPIHAKAKTPLIKDATIITLIGPILSAKKLGTILPLKLAFIILIK